MVASTDLITQTAMIETMVSEELNQSKAEYECQIPSDTEASQTFMFDGSNNSRSRCLNHVFL